MYKTIRLSLVLYGCETFFLTLREEHRLRVFEKRVLRRTNGAKRLEVVETREDVIIRNFITCTNQLS
jgi:hypothetical protein